MIGGRWWGSVSLATLLCTLGAPAWGARHGGEQPDRLWVEAAQRSVREQRSALSQVAQASLPAVVSITTRQASTGADMEGEAQKGIGSGLIIHPDGYILTSAHVIEGAEDITISVLSERGYPEEYPAEVVGEDERTDFALLKIKAPRKLPVLKLSSASRVEVGDFVVVIGNPFGLTHSVTAGVVSAKGRTDVTPNGRDGDFDYMQVDASINPGNSGGPVLDVHGDVVAIANAVNVAGQGIGFAIPVDIAKAVLPHLRKYGRVRRGWMGVSVQDCSPDVIEAYGLTNPRGVVVSEVMDGGPASRAGLQVGDVIEGLDSARVDRAHKLRWQVASRGVGRNVVLRVRRGDRPLKLKVKLEDIPGDTEPVAPTLAGPAPAAHPDGEPATGGSGLPGEADGQAPGRSAPSP
ncbi:trypsin-like peptidase domain-containing protein [Archangium violaceum]|uniref:S1C family serine protease n=1 Tax=Archangium violaceum TaxID=83451 RepID=UPI00193BB2FD|nr:trypsin-like peptidase domain-containing protein [Archangium violaceum]QRK04269.1 trypsin-like peptidase domain-containing protein [Archangium violaceum]